MKYNQAGIFLNKGTTTERQYKIEAFDYRCLRKILNIDWRLHISNQQIRDTVGIPSACDIIKRQRLKWFGHVIRMENTRLPRQILLKWEPPNRKITRGRPITTWKTTIERDLKNIRHNWSWEEAVNTAKDRNEWFKMLPIAPPGVRSNR